HLRLTSLPTRRSSDLTVVATNTAPVANAQNLTTPEDTATNLVLSASDVDGNALTFVILSGPTNGALSAVNTNTGAMTYTPNTNRSEELTSELQSPDHI